MDWPTFLDYFGGEPPDHILEGRSLMPLLRGEQPSGWRKVVFSEYDYCMQDVRLKLNQPIEQCRLFMVFDGRWKYIHASGFRPMLYDLLDDPGELIDRGEDSSCADVMVRLQAALFDWALHPKGHITTTNKVVNNRRTAAIGHPRHRNASTFSSCDPVKCGMVPLLGTP